MDSTKRAVHPFCALDPINVCKLICSTDTASYKAVNGFKKLTVNMTKISDKLIVNFDFEPSVTTRLKRFSSIS